MRTPYYSKFLLFLLFLTGGIYFTSCVDKDVDLDKMSKDILWDGELGFPIAFLKDKKVTGRDIINEYQDEDKPAFLDSTLSGGLQLVSVRYKDTFSGGSGKIYADISTDMFESEFWFKDPHFVFNVTNNTGIPFKLKKLTARINSYDADDTEINGKSLVINGGAGFNNFGTNSIRITKDAKLTYPGLDFSSDIYEAFIGHSLKGVMVDFEPAGATVEAKLILPFWLNKVKLAYTYILENQNIEKEVNDAFGDKYELVNATVVIRLEYRNHLPFQLGVTAELKDGSGNVIKEIKPRADGTPYIMMPQFDKATGLVKKDGESTGTLIYELSYEDLKGNLDLFCFASDDNKEIKMRTSDWLDLTLRLSLKNFQIKEK